MNLLSLHSRIYEATDGLIGHRLIGVPCLLLRTTGRKTGKVRTVTLVYARDGARYLVVASNNGRDRPPAWLLNLQQQPAAEIQVGREHRPATAAVITPDDADFPRVWQLINAGNHGRYDRYQARTSRRIPVVALTPA